MKEFVWILTIFPALNYPFPSFSSRKIGRLTGTTLVGLAEHDKLDLVVDGQDTGTSNTTEDVGTSTLEEGLNTLLSNDGAESVEGRVVLDGLTTMGTLVKIGIY